MKTLIAHLIENVRASAWTLPATYVAAAITAAFFGLWVDRTYIYEIEGWTEWLRVSSPGTALSILSAIATSVLALAGVSFSSILVTMSLASQQFGPRLLRNFMKDRVGQGAMGIMIGTYLFCLITMRRIDPDAQNIQVPQITTLIALVFALLCLVSFIRFIHHILVEIQAESVVTDAYGNLISTIKATFPDAVELDEYPTATDLQYNENADGWEILAGKHGYLQAVNHDELIDVAADQEAILALHCRPGDFLARQEAVVRVVSGPNIDNFPDSAAKRIRKALFVGPVRTPEADYEYGFRQLVEVALRALSPGINDPFTAMDCLDYIRAGLEEVFVRPLPPRVLRDSEGAVRLLTQGSSYKGLVDSGCDQIRRAAMERCDVSCKLLEILQHVTQVARRADQLVALQEQGNLVHENTLPLMQNAHDRCQISTRYGKLRESVTVALETLQAGGDDVGAEVANIDAQA